MTEGQVKYQQHMETVRHNREMERYNEKQAETARRDLEIKERLEPYERGVKDSQGMANYAKMWESFFGGFANLGKGYSSIFNAIGSLFM